LIGDFFYPEHNLVGTERDEGVDPRQYGSGKQIEGADHRLKEDGHLSHRETISNAHTRSGSKRVIRFGPILHFTFFKKP
jgi:hypothetical protein